VSTHLDYKLPSQYGFHVDGKAFRLREHLGFQVMQGNIFDHEHEYEIHEGRRKVAEVSKKWFPVADTYGVDIVSGVDDIWVLAITVVIDMMLDQGC
jgi:uncharacterized protein YxjI